MDYPNFISYLEEKYGVIAEKLNTVSNQFSISHYYYKGKSNDTQEIISSYNYLMSKETYAKLDGSQKEGWHPKSIFDHENELNESKRTIKMLRSTYINEFKTQFKDLING
jgi:archaellum component FlaC